MKYKINFYRQIPDGEKPSGIPDIWPSTIEEVDDNYKALDGETIFTSTEYNSYINANKNIYDAWFDNYNLQNIKNVRYTEIDKKTTKLISDGFTFSKKQFSLSSSAQNTLTGLYAIRDEVGLSYPILWNTLDDSDIFELSDSDMVKIFYLTAVATYRAHLDSGTVLKNSIRLAEDRAIIDSIIDER